MKFVLVEMNNSKAANTLGGKTARPCDNCLVKRARWFCAADDAFLCQACDTSVHSANQLAGRHDRVRLETASFRAYGSDLMNSCSVPSWQKGFTRKARTMTSRRPAKSAHQVFNNPAPLVPEINSEDLFGEEKEDLEQLVHTVPDFVVDEEDPFVNEFEMNLADLINGCDEFKFGASVGDLGSDLDGKRVKVEEDDDGDEEVPIANHFHFDCNIDMEMNWEFDDYACSINEEEAKGVVTGAIGNMATNMGNESGSKGEKRTLLRLNYEEVIDAWANKGSPWENGVRPCLDIDGFMAECAGGDWHPYEGAKRQDQADREARVLRYKEKRRTRLFSKKIRYEVRKLNAEKRPRMKGRFVKRANFSAPSLSYTMTT